MPAFYYKSLRYIPEKSDSIDIVCNSYDEFINLDKNGYYINRVSFQYHPDNNAYLSSIGHDRSWPGRIVSLQSDKEMRLHYITEGEVSIDGIRRGKGEFFFIIPGQSPARELKFISEDAELYYIIIKGKCLAELIINNCFYKIRTGSYASIMPEIKKLFNDIIYGKHDGMDATLHIYGLFYHILAYQKYLNLQLGTKEHKTANPLAIQAMRIISDEFTNKLSVSDIAEQLHVCPDYLSRILRNEIGYSAQTIITKKRMELAQALLLEKPYKPLADIAMLCGYDDYVYFCKQFHKHALMTPNAYRKKSELSDEPNKK
jgi:AraC-like DNA-binding protein